MLADNPLSEQFIENHPVEAARVLETLSPQHTVHFLQEVEHEKAVHLLHYFMPAYTARCLLIMSDKLLNDFTQHTIGDVCRAFPTMNVEQQQATIQRLSSRLARQVKNRLSYPADSVANYFSQRCPIFPGSLATGEALRQLEDMNYDEGCPINVVDDEHKLVGCIDSARMLTASRKELLGKLVSTHKRPRILISSRIIDVESNQGWLTYRHLPVVDRNGVYMGELDYETVRQYQQQTEYLHQPTEAFASLLSLAGVYWLSASWLLECLLGGTAKNKRNDE